MKSKGVIVEITISSTVLDVATLSFTEKLEVCRVNKRIIPE